MAWKSNTLAALGALLLTTSAGAIAQTTTADPTLDAMPVERDDDDGDEGKLGWIGLLGLAGLLGLKRRDRDDDHRHTTTTTGTNNRL